MIYFTAHIKFILFATLFFATTGATFAADGDLDLSFDGDGIVTTDNGLNIEIVWDLAVQPDGKIIAAGSSSQNSSMRRAVIVRYLPNGSIDSTFGLSGKVIIQSVFPSELALQPDGKIVLAGYTETSPNLDFYVARLNSDGSFDATFNGTGAVILDLRGTSDRASSVKIQSDGKIVVGGISAGPGSNPQNPQSDFAIVRLNAGGALDTTFDGDGKVFTTLQETAGINNLAIQPNGKIVAAGEAFLTEASSGNPIGSFATVRYNSNGAIDTTFNGNGVAFTQFSLNPTPGGTRNNTPNTVIIRTGGKILVVGTTRSCCGPQPQSQVAMIQYNPDGSPDSSFGTAGKIQTGFTTFPETSANDAAIQADNKIVIAGTTQGNIKAPVRLLVGRFNANGSLDLTFSGDGWNTLQLSPGNPFGYAVAVQPDGKIVSGGTIGSSERDFLLARFEASSCRTATCSGERQKVADFDGDGRTDLSVFRNGTWFVNPSGANNPNSFYGVQFGLTTDKLTPADFDGDGKTDIAVWRENVNGSFGYFYILQSATNSVRVAQFGQTGDDPRIVGDWDGDGRADPAVYRSGGSAGAPSFFFYRPSSQPSVDFVTVQWGTAGDEAVRGDFDGDGRMDAAVFRASDEIWYVRQSSNAQPRYERWGLASDKRVTGDFDGDGKTDFAIFRDGLWAILQSSNSQPRYERWGLSGDRLVAGDYDGDGRTDVAVWRAGVFYVLQTLSSQAAYRSFGGSDDIPVASAIVR